MQLSPIMRQQMEVHFSRGECLRKTHSIFDAASNFGYNHKEFIGSVIT